MADRWTIKTILEKAADYLKGRGGIPNPRLDAELLLAHLLKTTRMGLYLRFDQPLHDSEIVGYRSLIQRRARHEPLQYITRSQEFWSLEFSVDPRVLIPRPESELLVETALSLIRTTVRSSDRPPILLDLGTGSGALAVSLAKELKDAIIWATDRSRAALEVARVNAENHGVAERIHFRSGDLWAPFHEEKVLFDVIVSNPPYVASEDYETLPPEVRDHEPRLALDGHEKGMRTVREIIKTAPRHLSREGWLLVEMAPEQTEEALALIAETGQYVRGDRKKDYTRRFRVVIAQKASNTSSTFPSTAPNTG
jgi:release factor glutamine methyltransferase